MLACSLLPNLPCLASLLGMRAEKCNSGAILLIPVIMLCHCQQQDARKVVVEALLRKRGKKSEILALPDGARRTIGQQEAESLHARDNCSHRQNCQQSKYSLSKRGAVLVMRLRRECELFMLYGFNASSSLNYCAVVVVVVCACVNHTASQRFGSGRLRASSLSPLCRGLCGSGLSNPFAFFV